MKTILTIFLGMLTVAAFAEETAIERFRLSHPEKAAHYTLLALTSFDAEIYHAELALVDRFSVAERAFKAANLSGVERTKTDGFFQGLRSDGEAEVDFWKKAKTEAVSGDVLCFFSWRDGQKVRSGHLVLNGGDICREWTHSEGEDFIGLKDL